MTNWAAFFAVCLAATIVAETSAGRHSKKTSLKDVSVSKGEASANGDNSEEDLTTTHLATLEGKVHPKSHDPGEPHLSLKGRGKKGGQDKHEELKEVKQELGKFLKGRPKNRNKNAGPYKNHAKDLIPSEFADPYGSRILAEYNVPAYGYAPDGSGYGIPQYGYQQPPPGAASVYPAFAGAQGLSPGFYYPPPRHTNHNPSEWDPKAIYPFSLGGKGGPISFGGPGYSGAQAAYPGKLSSYLQTFYPGQRGYGQQRDYGQQNGYGFHVHAYPGYSNVPTLPGLQSAYPVGSLPYSDPRFGYSSKLSDYSGIQSFYPGQSGYPSGKLSNYPGTQSFYPSQTGYPSGKLSSYPGTHAVYPSAQPGYPGQQSNYPGTYFDPLSLYPAKLSAYPDAQSIYPSAKPYPGAQTIYPNPVSAYPGSVSFYPSQTYQIPAEQGYNYPRIPSASHA